MTKAEKLSGRDLAEARDAWLASEEGSRMRKGSAEGPYLENRLVLAFYAGVTAAQEYAAKLKRAKANVKKAAQGGAR